MPRLVNVKATRVISAPPARVYSVLADYRTGHPRVLPRAFADMTVEAGGRGAGTVISFSMKSLGRTRRVRARVEEPEPGRVLLERIEDPVVETTFTVDASGNGCSSVAIETSWTPRGPGAFLERLLGPVLLKRVYAEELTNLQRVATTAGGSS